jgi:hypothetical protein
MVFFNTKLITLEKVKATISAPMMKVHFRGGEVKEVKNPYKSKPNGKVFPAAKFINKKI